MVLKSKHSKKLLKARQKKEVERKKREPEIDFDTSAYIIYNRLEMTYPCLSFDIVTSDQQRDAKDIKFPFSINIIAGAQTPPHVENNYIYVMKIDNIRPLKQENDTIKDEESDEEEEEEENPEQLPKLSSIRVSHKGCVNRLRVKKTSGRLLTASWSDKGKVFIYDLTTPLQAVSDPRSINTYVAQKNDPKPIYSFAGHQSEGYALDWAPHKLGSLATGDCKKNIHLWTMRSQSDWSVDQVPLVGHEKSVEDIKWSPEEADILASCSVDQSIRLWDLRLSGTAKCVTRVLESHKSDVNVIDWNRRSKNLLVSGGDDGVVKFWDIRFLKKNDQEAFPVAQFDYHKGPITSVEWNPNDDTVMAVASEDDRLTLWDLAVENDEEQEEADMKMEVDKKDNEDNPKNDDDSSSSSSSDDEDDDDEEEPEMEDDKGDEDGVEYGDLNFKKIPEQMLFLHQGQAEIKELHWHPQFDGLLISTAANGINLFKTISA